MIPSHNLDSVFCTLHDRDLEKHKQAVRDNSERPLRTNALHKSVATARQDYAFVMQAAENSGYTHCALLAD